MLRLVITMLLGILLLAACGGSSNEPVSIRPVRSPDRTPLVQATPQPAGGAPTGDAGGTPAPPAGDVYLVLERNQCLGCHMAGDRGVAGAGNDLNGLAARIPSYGLDISPSEYVRQSILQPGAYVVPECPAGPCANIMPSYAERLNEAELELIVAFLLEQ